VIAPKEGVEAALSTQQQQRQLPFLGVGIHAGAVDAGAVLTHHGAQLVAAKATINA